MAAKKLDPDSERFIQKTGSRFRCADDVLLNIGKIYEPKPVPQGIQTGVCNRCYANAMDVVRLDEQRFTYVEGYGIYRDLIWPVWHAWVLDNEDGLVFDNTPNWPSLETVYWGLAMPKMVVVAAGLRNGSWGVFEGDWKGDFHFVREGWRDCV